MIINDKSSTGVTFIGFPKIPPYSLGMRNKYFLYNPEELVYLHMALVCRNTGVGIQEKFIERDGFFAEQPEFHLDEDENELLVVYATDY